MAPPASKRRKLSHSSVEEDGDNSSFASFGAAADEDEVVGDDGEVEDEESLEDLNGAEEEESDDEMDDEDNMNDAQDHSKNTVSSQTSKRSATASKEPSALRKRSGDERLFASGNFKSNMFKLQVDDLLEQVRPRQGKREKAAEEALHQIKSTIDALPSRSPLPVAEAQQQLLTKSKVAVPFPQPPPPTDAKYKLEYRKPAKVDVTGSYVLKTASRAREVQAIDMVLTMPPDMFQDKDFMNYRFFYKRAYYLACVAAGLKSKHAAQYDIRFVDFHDNALQPVIVIESPDKDAKLLWRINVLAFISANTFSAEKLYLDKNCVRGLNTNDGKAEQDVSQKATPFYNSSLRADMLVIPYLKLLHSASKTCKAFTDACLLGSTWLRQRGLGSDVHAGGFGSFEWSGLIALLLSGGGPKGTPILSPGYSSYQLFKATLQVLAMKDLGKQPLVVGSDQHAPKSLSDGAPVVWDAERKHNLLYRLAPWAYRRLRQEARATLSMLGDQQYDGFDATFILRSDGLLYRYDSIIEVPLDDREMTRQDHMPFEGLQVMYQALRKGLGDRVSEVNIIPPQPSSWDVGNDRVSSQSRKSYRVGFVVNSETVGRTVDHGPSAEDKATAADFRKFWGEKAELRRFKDGSILESLVWSAKEGGESVLEQIVRYVISKHVGEDAGAGVVFHGDGVTKLLPHGATAAPYNTLTEAYKQLESDIRSLDGLPLSIRQIMPADSQLRNASLNLPLSGPRPQPADITIQFEGSGRWPDDLPAIQRTKIAFLLKLSEMLQDSHSDAITSRIGLENPDYDILNQAYLDFIYTDSGAAFRLRIHHDREQTLLERQLKDKSLDPRSKEIAALGLAKWKRDYIKTPVHTEALARLCSRHPTLSGTIRLMKKWFASHLLANHIPDPIVELLVARTYVQPWPWHTPGSVQTAFLRTLFFLARWDWRAEPLIVDLSPAGDGLRDEDVRHMTGRFEAWRKIDPAMNRVVLFAASNVDCEGTTWTDGCPSKVVAGRMTALARAAVEEMKARELGLDVGNLFVSPLEDFDFVLHLKPELLGKTAKASKKGREFKNLSLALPGAEDPALVGHDPVASYLAELEDLFGAAVLFFSGAPERAVIAGLWSPAATTERSWKLGLAFSSLPKAMGKGDEGEVQATVNTEGVLAEIARVGGGVIGRVDVKEVR